MKRIILGVLILLLGACAGRKDSVDGNSKGGTTLEFVKTTHDFGHINEEGGLVSYQFKFVNKGDEPAIIAQVKVTCGCTTPEWTKSPVLPGDSGIIKAVFDPKGRPGILNKSLTVYSNSKDSTIALFIIGIVNKPSVSEKYLDSIGNIYMTSKYLNLGSMTTKEVISKDFEFYNNSLQPITFINSRSPKYIRINNLPKTIYPKESGFLSINFDPKTKNELGPVGDSITLETNDVKSKMKILRAYAYVTEYFPPLSDTELEKSPKISFDRKINDFGKVKEGLVVKTKFKVSNTGKSNLNVRKVVTSCGCTSAFIEKSNLRPGESTYINVSFDSKGREGGDSKSISVFSNDPAYPTEALIINSNVVN